MTSKDDETLNETRSEANQMIGAGLGIGAFGAASAVLLGATCPLCVVAAPALIGVGVVKRWRARRAAPAAPLVEPTKEEA